MAQHNQSSEIRSVELYYHILGGLIRSKLLSTVMDCGLVELMGSDGSLSEQQIIAGLKLSDKPAKKWLDLLTVEGFLLKTEQADVMFYSLSPMLKSLAQNTDTWGFYKEFMKSWEGVASENMTAVLQGGAPSQELKWPPTSDVSEHVEDWMTRSAQTPALLIKKYLPISQIQKILDVGGGEGTICCYLASWYPHLHLTNYNLPESIKLTRKKIKSENLEDRIATIEGNFLTDQAFPKGYDLFLFSRVLCDWPDEVCIKLLKMAYEALEEGGYVLICDPYRGATPSLIKVWEYRYLFWNDFGRGVFKEPSHYMLMLERIGFKNIEIHKNANEDMYQVIRAMK